MVGILVDSFFNRFHQVLVIFSYDQHFTLAQDWFQQVPLAMISIFVKFHRFHPVLVTVSHDRWYFSLR